MVCIWLNGLAPWCIRFYAPCSSGQWHRQHRAKRPDRILGDCPQSFQEATEDAFLFVVIAVADPHAPSVAPDLGCEKQESQAGCRQRSVLESFDLGVVLAIEQHQPAIQVIGQHSPAESDYSSLPNGPRDVPPN